MSTLDFTWRLFWKLHNQPGHPASAPTAPQPGSLRPTGADPVPGQGPGIRVVRACDNSADPDRNLVVIDNSADKGAHNMLLDEPLRSAKDYSLDALASFESRFS